MKKRKFIFIIALLIALLGISLLIIAAADSGLPIEDFIVSVAIEDLLGNPITGSAVLGNNYKIFITFEEGWNEAMDQIPHTDGVVTYYLPTGFLAPEPRSNVPIHSTAPPYYPVVAHYNVYEDGRVEITFLNVDKEGNEISESFIEHFHNAMFTIEITAQFVGSAEDIEIVFGSHVIKNITLIPPEPPVVVPELRVEKTRSEYDKSTQSIDYVIVITAHGGPISDISLHDIFGGTYAVPSALASAALSQVIVQVRDDEPTTIISIPWKDNTGSFVLDFPDVTLDPGETIIITYTLDVGPFIEAWGDEASGHRNYYFDLSNSAVVVGTDVNDPENGPGDSSFVWVRIHNEFLRKVVSDNRDGVLRWDCTIGDGVTLLNGVVIRDTPGPGLTITNPSLIAYLRGADGNTFYEYSFPVDPGGTGFSFTVPDDLGDVYSVYIPYFTEVDFNVQATGGLYRNHLEVGLPGRPFVEAEIRAKAPGVYVNKSHLLNVDSIDWTIDFYIPGALFGETIWLVDSLTLAYLNQNGAHVWESAVNQPSNFTVSASRQDGSEVEEFIWTMLDAGDTQFATAWNARNIWVLFFGDSQATSQSPFERDTIVTVTFSTPLTAGLLAHRRFDETFLGMETIGDVLKQVPVGDAFSFVLNHIDVYQAVGASHQVLTNDEDSVKWPIYKSAVYLGDGVYRFTVVLDSGMFLPNQEAFFIDQFDSGLEFVPYSSVIKHMGNLYAPRTDAGKGTHNYTITHSDGISTITVDLSAPYWWKVVGEGFEPAERGWYAATEGVYIVQYELRVADPEIDVQTYKNVATIYSTTRGQPFSAEYEIRHGSKPLDKKWVFAEAGAIAEVEIIINPDGLAFSPYGYYEVRDTMSDTLSLFVGSLRAYEQVSGKWELRELTEVANLADAHWTFAIMSGNEFALVLPDSVPVRITYNVLVKGAIGDTVEISNQVEIEGKAYDSVRNFFDIIEYDGGAFGDEIPVTLYKYDGENPETHLPGARFALYMGANIAGNQPTGLPADIPKTRVIEGATFYLIDYGITNELGIIVFDSSWLATFRTPRPYAIVEIDPPPGYALPDDPVTLFSFRDLSYMSESLGGREIHQIADNIRIANETEWPPIEEIPLAGGGGTMWFTLGGILIIGTALVLLWNVHRKHKKGPFTNGNIKRILKR